MSWDTYVSSLMDGNHASDAAIAGYQPGQEGIWSAHKGGFFCNVTPTEIRTLVSKDRGGLFSAGVTLGNHKCTVLRDSLYVDGQCTMDLRTKATDQNPETCCISIGRSDKALILIKGHKDTHGGTLNSKVYGMAEHLKKSGY